MALTGPEVLAAAERLVLAALRDAPEGLTSSEVERRTGLRLPTTDHPGYITWSILNYLVASGRVVSSGRGPYHRRYKLAAPIP